MPSLDTLTAQVAAYNALMVDRPFKTGLPVERDDGLPGLPASRFAEEVDVYRLAAQVEAFVSLHGGHIVGCHAAGGRWQPLYKRDKAQVAGMPE